MKCALNRFKTGTTTTRPNNSELSKEMQNKLSIMRAEREKQDRMWDEEPSTKSPNTTATTTNIICHNK